jgi:hypothetical protein
MTHHWDQNTPLLLERGPNEFEVDLNFCLLDDVVVTATLSNLELESQLIRDLPPKALGASLWAGLT